MEPADMSPPQLYMQQNLVPEPYGLANEVEICSMQSWSDGWQHAPLHQQEPRHLQYDFAHAAPPQPCSSSWQQSNTPPSSSFPDISVDNTSLLSSDDSYAEHNSSDGVNSCAAPPPQQLPPLQASVLGAYNGVTHHQHHQQPPPQPPRKRRFDDENAAVIPKRAVKPRMDTDYMEQTFAQVHGRLSIFNNIQHRVTVGEVQRRAAAPECFTRLDLNNYLRKARTTDSAAELSAELQKHGIELNATRQTLYNLNMLTLLTEGEAEMLGRDSATLLLETFPFEKLAAHIESTTRDRRRLHEQATLAAEFCDEFRQLLDEWKEELRHEQPTSENPLLLFNVLTRGFGLSECVAYVKALRKLAVAITNPQPAENRAAEHRPFSQPEQALAMEEHLPEQFGAEIVIELAARLHTNRKFRVETAEIRRRVCGPEEMTFSNLAKYLKRGKTKSSTEKFRAQLDDAAIPQIRKTHGAPRFTLLSALCEEEAILLAENMNMMTRQAFKLNEVAKMLNERADVSTAQLLHRRECMLQAASTIASLAHDVIQASPLPRMSFTPKPRAPTSQMFASFNLLTHCFGPPEAMVWFKLLSDLASACASTL